MRWFISDLHFGHENIINYCSRPFRTAAEMDQKMIQQWNLYVQPYDEVYVVGDVVFGGARESEKVLSQLQGRKHLILGNHDYLHRKVKPFLKKYFATIESTRSLCIEPVGRAVTLSHYPLYGHEVPKILIHGHSHNNRPLVTTYKSTRQLLINVSVENIEYTPISETRISEIIEQHTQFLRGGI